MTIEAEFVSTLGKDELLFRRMEGFEELGRVYEVRLELLRHESRGQVKAKDLLGAHVGVRVKNPDDSWRYVNGTCTRFERGGMIGRFDIYRLELRPWLWELTLTTDCRIFQNKTAIEILDEIFAEYSAASKVEKRVSGSLRKRPYTVQYNESDLNFVTRLMEQEGIYYYFKHTKDKHTLVLCNDASGHGPAKVSTLLWSPAATKNELREDVITHWHRAHALRSLKYSHTDFAAEAPTTSLMASATRRAPYPKPSNPKKFEVHRYPGGHDDGAMKPGSKVQGGTQDAEVEVARFESGHSVASALTSERELVVGSTFTLKDHPEDDGGYLVTRAVYEMEFAGYEANPDELSTSYNCRFDAVPKAITFQPETSAELVQMRGPQTALVVGPSADEIHTDEFGRVRIHFPWDRVGKKNEQSSAWVRVVQPWAGKGFGAVFLPRVGDEVLVDFESGDPDHPIVVGRVYNGDNKHPWPLPAQATVSGIKTRSSKSGDASTANELRFDDKKGSEYVWFQAEKDYHHWVKDNATVTIKGMRKQQIEKDDQLKVTGKYEGDIGKDATLKVATDVNTGIGGDLILKVGGATGLTISGTTKLKSSGGISITGEAALDVTASSGVKINSDAALHIKANSGITIDGGTQLAIKAGAGFIVLDASGVSIVGPMVKINSGGSAPPAQKALKATVPAAKEPPAPPEHKDPLAN